MNNVKPFNKKEEALSFIDEKSVDFSAHDEIYLMWDEHNDEYWVAWHPFDLFKRIGESYADSGYELLPEEEIKLYQISKYVTVDYRDRLKECFNPVYKEFQPAHRENLMFRVIELDAISTVSFGFK